MSDAWDTLDWIGHDRLLGFADGGIELSRYSAAFDEEVIVGSRSDPPCVVCFTDCDDDVPVEVQRNADGRVIAARMCWTTDVDQLDGTSGEWRGVGSLRIDSGMCRAWSPAFRGGCVFDLTPGTYAAKAFYTEHNDCLGLRIVHCARGLGLA